MTKAPARTVRPSDPGEGCLDTRASSLTSPSHFYLLKSEMDAGMQREQAESSKCLFNLIPNPWGRGYNLLLNIPAKVSLLFTGKKSGPEKCIILSVLTSVSLSLHL